MWRESQGQSKKGGWRGTGVLHKERSTIGKTDIELEIQGRRGGRPERRFWTVLSGRINVRSYNRLTFYKRKKVEA